MTDLSDLLARARLIRLEHRRERGDRSLTLSERAARSLRVRHANSYHKDRRLAEQLARGLGDTHAGRAVGLQSGQAKIVRSRIIDDPPRSCHPCDHCIELRWRFRERILQWRGQYVKVGPVSYSDHHQLRYYARRRGRLLVRRGADYWLLNPEEALNFDQASRAVEALPERPGLPTIGRIPGEGDRVLAELRVLAAEEGLLLHRRGEDHWLLDPQDAMDVGELADVLG